jgi:glycosyltransferase involved in cell wall biosynthesis
VKILLVTNYQPPHMGGIEFAARSLKACWERNGHRVTWLTTDIPRGAGPKSPDHVRVAAANFAERWWQINAPCVSPLAYPRIARLVRTHDVVNIHSLAPGLSAVALRAALRGHRPLVVTQHVGVIPMGHPLLGWLQQQYVCRAARRAVRHGAPLTFVGEAVRTWFLEHAQLRADQVYMTPAGLDRETFHFVPDDERPALRARWQLENGRLQVLFVGRFYDKKGLPLLREVAARCPDVCFTLVGGGPLDPTSWALPNVRVLGFEPDQDLRGLYGAHDLFLMPSFGEGWPAVVPQAMACGTACLVSEETFLGFNRDADRFLVQPRRADAMAAALQRAARGEEPLLRQRKVLSDYALDTWDWPRTARIYEDLFRQVQSP